MTNDEIAALIDQVYEVAMNEIDPELMRRRLTYLLMPALERIAPVSWEVSTKGERVSFRIAAHHFLLEDSQGAIEGETDRARTERNATQRNATAGGADQVAGRATAEV